MSQLPEEFDLNDIEAVREHRYALLQAVEATAALIQVEEHDDEPNRDWLKRAKVFMFRGKAALCHLDQEDKEAWRSHEAELQQALRKREEARQNALTQCEVWRSRFREAQERSKAAEKETRRLSHELTQALAQLAATKRKQEAAQTACDGMNSELQELKSQLGLERFLEIVSSARRYRGIEP